MAKHSPTAKRLVVVMGCLLILAAPAVIAYWNMWPRLPSSALESRLQHITPTGTSMRAVKEQVEKRGWRIVSESDQVGALLETEIPPGNLGSMHIRVVMGSYTGLPWDVSVGVVWGFDKDSALIGLVVRKTADAL